MRVSENVEIITVEMTGDRTAKEVNAVTNPKMGKRHVAYESMLREFEVVLPLDDTFGTPFLAALINVNMYKVGTRHEAKIVDGEAYILIEE